MTCFPALRLTAVLSLALLATACAGNGAVRGSADSARVVGDAPAAMTAADVAQAPSSPADGTDAVPVAAGGAITTDPVVAADAPASATDNNTRTQAEQDYDAIYGVPYNPVADPTLPAPAQLPTSYDPWEKFNRKVHKFNNVVDRAIAKPLAKAYVAVVPRPLRLGVGNFFNNLGQPVNIVNSLLQGKPRQAGQALGRFLLNSTVGIAGIFDPATRANIPNKSEDFGQTLGKWGWKRSRYLELPLFGPRTVRDTFGLVGDAPLSPTRYIERDRTRVFLQGLQMVDVRTQLFAVDAMRQGATDDYALVRDAWMQRRSYQINGDNQHADANDLPEYLRDDDTNPTVPADAMPMIPGPTR